MQFEIQGRAIGPDQPTYFVADLAANHDGDLDRAIHLIRLAAEAGAEAAKFQNFTAEKIVSDYGFRNLGAKTSHQASWDKSVVDVYRDASIPASWTPRLRDACQAEGIAYFSAPYDLEAIEDLDPYVPAFKVGSGDITWLDSIEAMGRKGKPVLLATGASDIDEVQAALDPLLAVNQQVCLMQCNTNYTGSADNFDHINLRVLESFRLLYPEVVLGLSDHTPGFATVLGAVALGARVVEKHFTDDCTRTGPDHGFSLDPDSWSNMVEATRQLERALGRTDKRVEPNELETVVLQRRCVRARNPLPAGHVLTEDDLVVLRPATPGALLPNDLQAAVGQRLTVALEEGQHVTWRDIG